jgi:hypothetical protein
VSRHRTLQAGLLRLAALHPSQRAVPLAALVKKSAELAASRRRLGRGRTRRALPHAPLAIRRSILPEHLIIAPSAKEQSALRRAQQQPSTQAAHARACAAARCKLTWRSTIAAWSGA